jgi:hypothetical protein
MEFFGFGGKKTVLAVAVLVFGQESDSGGLICGVWVRWRRKKRAKWGWKFTKIGKSSAVLNSSEHFLTEVDRN